MTAKKRAAPAGLSRELVRAAALKLIDREGLDAFSTRKLGAALGCEAMAIYWYYPNKDALLDAVVDELIAPLAAAVAAGGADWIATLRAVARAYRAIAHDHPHAFPLLATRRFASDDAFAFMDALFELAARAGIPDRVAARYYRIVSSYCSGFALNELAAPGRPAKRFARVAAVARYLEPAHLDELFEAGLDVQLAALAREIPANDRARGGS